MDWNGLVNGFGQFCDDMQPFIEWVQANWLTLVLTGEIAGAFIALRMGKMKKGLCWLAAALVTIWIGGFP